MKNVLTLYVMLFGVLVSFGQAYTSNSSSGISTNSRLRYAVAWADIDNDNDADLYITVGGTSSNANELYRNNGNGTFSLISTSPASTDLGNSRGATFGDLDNDGDLDLYVCNIGIDAVYRNNGTGSFTKVTSGPFTVDNGDSRNVHMGDYDNDGDIDLFIASKGSNNRIYKNNGNWSFTKLSTGAIVNDGGNSLSMALSDLDLDGDLDVYVSNTNGGKNFLYENQGNGSFVKVTTTPLTSSSLWSTGCVFSDYDGDMDLDIMVSNLNNQNNELYRNDGNFNFTKMTGLGNLVNNTNSTVSGMFIDIDNDRDLDYYAVNKDNQKNRIYFNRSGTFVDTVFAPLTSNSTFTLSGGWNDYDLDGDLDLMMPVYNGAIEFYEANGGIGNWLKIRLHGTVSNKFGIGAKIYTKSGGVWQFNELKSTQAYHSQNGYTEYVGVGNSSAVDSLKIVWPSGIVCYYEDLPVNNRYDFAENCTRLYCVDSAMFNPSSNNFCENDSIFLNNLSSAGGQFDWLDNGNYISNDSNIYFAGNSGNHNITLAWKDKTGCHDTVMKTVNIWPEPSVSFNGLNLTYCKNDSASQLSGSPVGGVFNGCGIVGASFFPDSCGVGSHVISYMYSDSSGCSGVDTQQVVIIAPTKVTLTGLDSVECVDNPGVTLYGYPSGGSYSGPGVSGNLFSPTSVGMGSYWIYYTYTDQNNCVITDSAFVRVEECLSIGELDLSEKIEIGPNPAKSYFNINMLGDDLSNELSLEVFDSYGKTVFESQTLVHKVSCENWSRGMYLVVITDGNANKHLTKLVID